ncbi:MAG: 2OG-Fe dioxygenase family protein [Myxococcota bacterium]
MDRALELLSERGFAFAEGKACRAVMERAGADFSDWEAFAASWNDLGDDPYLARQHMQRRRRHGVYRAQAGARPDRLPNRPHYQAPEYNPLQGGIDRHFEAIDAAVGAGATMTSLIGFGAEFFSKLAEAGVAFDVEAHQFRIEACSDDPGFPTPEGAHRDGVDFVLVLMVHRENLRSGTTTIHALDGEELGAFTLEAPFDAAFVHDRRVLHGVTPVEILEPSRPAFRDVLVVTYRIAAAAKT